jgi:hypothetical protein
VFDASEFPRSGYTATTARSVDPTLKSISKAGALAADHGRPGQGRARQAGQNQGRADQGRAGQGRAGKGRPRQTMADHGRPG